MLEETTLNQLFKKEYSKILPVALRLFGTHRIDLAEDATQEALLSAVQHWKKNGLPKNPTAWLITVLKHKAIDIIRKKSKELTQDPLVSPLLTSGYSMTIAVEQSFSKQEIEDDQLRLMFVCCHPSLSTEAQISLILQTLCGFSVSQISKALVAEYDTIEKRLYRAKKTWRDQQISLEWPGVSEMPTRLKIVLTALYLLFNEGYHSADKDMLMNEELMADAIRLGHLLIDHVPDIDSSAFALISLFYFQFARRHSRVNAHGELIKLADQDRSLWDQNLIRIANHFLIRAMQSEQLSRYHLEAAIAHQHASAATFVATNWAVIKSYYFTLSKVFPSPIVEINRALAVCAQSGPEAALQILKNISIYNMASNGSLYHAAYAEVLSVNQNKEEAAYHINQAIRYSKSKVETAFFKKQLEVLES